MTICELSISLDILLISTVFVGGDSKNRASEKTFHQKKYVWKTIRYCKSNR